MSTIKTDKWFIPRSPLKRVIIFFNVYWQFVIKKHTLLFRLFFFIITLSFRVLSSLFRTRYNNLLMVETPTLYAGKGIEKDPDIFNEKSFYILWHTIMTCSHIWPILSIIFFHRSILVSIFISVGCGFNLNFSISSIESWDHNNI